MPTNNWIEVDLHGLGDLIEDRPRLVIELVSNACDEIGTTRVAITLHHLRGTRLAELIVDDDNPSGFADLTHAYRLFAGDNPKRSDPTVRGRFSMGEKLVLAALCQKATILSTTGTVVFAKDGSRHVDSRRKREGGTRFHGIVRMTQDEIARVQGLMDQIIPPAHISITYNDEPLIAPKLLHEFEANLPTVVDNRRTRRNTTIKIYEPYESEPSIYELGIPVVEIDCPWHVDVQQKVPLNLNRDNVTPAYLRELVTLVLNEMHERLTPEQAAAPWIGVALASPDVTAQATTSVVEARFGPRAVVRDPSDPEASRIAASQGYNVVPPNAFTKQQWENIRAAGALLPAGRVTPSPRILTDPTMPPPLPEEEWTPGMRKTAALIHRLAPTLIACDVTIQFRHITGPVQACYGDRCLTFNLNLLPGTFFDDCPSQELMELILHELGHHFGDHLEASYHAALCRMGAKLYLMEPPL